ncbi:MAG: putative bifunctional diguanylate cyclase/phosphodiesterase [Pseudomonadales bacterium]
MSTPRVYIVEDEVLVARDVQSRLEKLGYRVIGSAARGEDAVAQVLNDLPDLILMDINLKGDMDGIEAANRIRAEVDLPIIFCTAYSNDETLARAKVTVPYGYVLKPFDNRELEITIEIALHKHEMELALKLASVRLDATLRNLSDGVITVDSKGEILLANPMASSLLGIDQAALVGQTVHEVLQFSALNSGDDVIDLQALIEGVSKDSVFSTRQYLATQNKPLPVAVSMNWFSIGSEMLLVIDLQNLTLQIEQEAQLVRTAFFDDLTALPNRQLFLDRLNTRMVSSQAESREVTQTFALVMLSLVGLSVINQGLGFAAGDEAIIEVAHRIQSLSGPEDTVSHLGSGRFAILISDAGDPGAVLATLQAIQALIQHNIDWQSASKVNVVSHAGLVFGPGDYVVAADVIRDGEIALERAKQEGIDCVVFDVAMHEKAKRMLDLRSQLQEAIDQKVLVPHYQPIVDLQTLKIVSFEALVRWPLSADQYVAPDEFVPLAERSGLVLLLGDLMLESVCKQVREFEDNGIDSVSVAVNISSEQFTEVLVDRLDALISQYEIAPNHITLEITEGVAMAAIDSNLKLLEKFRARGHKISVDDFGTGYSSLAYLKRFPLDTLKIDRAFVQELKTASDDYIIAKAIIDLGHSLGLKIIAEGIETEDQLKLLQELGCDLGQGFYFQKASPPETVTQCYAAGLPLGRAQTA